MSNKFSAEPVFWKILTCFFEHLLDSNFPVALTTHWGHTRVHYRPVYIGRLQWDKPLESTNEKSRNIHSQTVNPEISITLICVKQIERTGTCSFCIICKQSLIYDPGFEHRCLQWVCTTLLNNYNYRYTYCIVISHSYILLTAIISSDKFTVTVTVTVIQFMYLPVHILSL